MHFADIDKILDRRVVLTMKQDNEIFLASREIEARIPINILEEENKKYMLINFPSSFGEVQKNRIFLKKYDAKNIGSHYVIRERINHVEKWKYIQEIMNLPSVVVNRINLKGGLIAFYFRYHHSVKNKISNILSNYTDGDDGQIETMDPSPGILKILDRLDQFYSLGMVQVSIPLTEEERTLVGFVRDDFIGESTNNLISGNGINAIVYTGETVENPQLNEIYGESGLYGMNLIDNTLQGWREKLNRIPVIRFRQFLRIRNDNLHILTLLPYSQTDLAYRAFFEEICESNRHNATLDFVSKYDRNIIMNL